MPQHAAATEASLPDIIPDPVNTLGLEVDPFSDELDIFFSGAERRAALDEIIHLCQFGNSLVAVLGEAGIGKTTLINEAYRELVESARCCVVRNVSEMVSIDDILDQIVAQLDLDISAESSAGEMLSAIRRYIPDDELERVVVVIDDAHYLDDKVLSALVSLLQGQQTYQLHVLLAGDHSLAERLDTFEMVDVLIYDIIIQPLRPEELEEYLTYRLSAAGYEGEAIFDANAVNDIWAKTRGIPGAADEVARQFLNAEMADDEGPASGLPIPHMAILVALLAVLIMALLYMGDDGAVESEPVVVLDDGAEPLGEEDSAAANTPVNLQPLPTLREREVAAGSQGVVSTVTKKEPADIVSHNIDRALADLESTKAGNTKTDTAASTPTLKEATDAPQTTPARPSSLSVDKVAAITAPVEAGKPPGKSEKSMARDQKILGSGGAQQQDALSANLKKQLAAEYRSIDGRTTEGGTRKTVAKSLSADERVVMGWPEAHYTLQVVAAGSKTSVETFIKAQPNRDVLRLVTTLRNNKPWYVVVAGHYKSRESARNALGLLPEKQVKSGAWARTISSLHKEMRTDR